MSGSRSSGSRSSGSRSFATAQARRVLELSPFHRKLGLTLLHFDAGIVGVQHPIETQAKWPASTSSAASYSAMLDAAAHLAALAYRSGLCRVQTQRLDLRRTLRSHPGPNAPLVAWARCTGDIHPLYSVDAFVAAVNEEPFEHFEQARANALCTASASILLTPARGN